MRLLKYFLVLCALTLNSALLIGQDRNDAYIYIEGDKSLPFYVKVEGQMQSRLSKHFFIVNQLAAGPTNIEIQFQKNEYPSQKFVINIPASGERSFMLKKVNETTFSLYDLEQNRYLMAGNSAEDDQIPTDPNKELGQLVAQNNTERQAANNSDEVPPFRVEDHSEPAERKNRRNKKESEQVPEFRIPDSEETDRKTVSSEKQKEERFVDFEMEGNKSTAKRNRRASDNGTVREETPRVSRTEEVEKPVQRQTANCSDAMSEVEFDRFASSLNDRSDEETRLSYLRKYGVKRCYNSEQVRILAMSFDSQSSRYEVGRLLFDRTTDKENYEVLLETFNTNFLKNKFKTEVLGK